MTVKRSESEILRAILEYFSYRGDVKAWRTNSGAVVAEYRGKRRFFRFNDMPGISDIIGYQVKPWGAQFLAVEVKSEHGKLTPAQASFLEMVRRAGGTALVAKSVADVAQELDGRTGVRAL